MLKNKITLEVSDVLHARLKAIAALKSQTVEHYCFSAIYDSLCEDENNGVKPLPNLAEAADRFERTQRELYAGKILSDSAEDIRRAREERSAQLEGK